MARIEKNRKRERERERERMNQNKSWSRTRESERIGDRVRGVEGRRRGGGMTKKPNYP